MHSANKYLIYYNYLGRAFRSSYSQHDSESASTVQYCLQSVFNAITKPSNTGALTVGVYTTAGTSALANTATVKLDLDKCLDNPSKIQFVVNKKLEKGRVPLKVFKVVKVPDEFCARKDVKSLDYVFRFCQAPDRSRLSVFEHSIVTCLGEQVCLDRLKTCLDTLSVPFKLRNCGDNFFGDNVKYESRFGEVELNNVPASGDCLVRANCLCFLCYGYSFVELSFETDESSCRRVGVGT